ncbi:hypothetical protein F4778DRAFT_757318 [Xylariomycetidae sp. FL2044]|nr:hypothetical protein F4778DRAFT_757318 [Xylariomycetidae sp. FL2044]
MATEGVDATVPKPRIGIVGAGISGLRCAEILLSRGFDVTILEARDRIGGRICQSNELGYSVDLGPNWIHASADPQAPNVIHDLAVETGTPVQDWNKVQTVYDSAGKVLPAETTDRLSTLLWDIIDDAFNHSAEARGADAGTSIAKDTSLYDFVRERAAELSLTDTDRELLVQLSEMFGAYIGEPIWKQSLRFAWMETCCGGEEQYVETDYSRILQRVASAALRDAEVLLGRHVAKIESPEDRKPGGKTQVWCSDGDMFRFDEVVVTTPLGWLKRNTEAFSPPLPERLRGAIGNISLSHLEKVYIRFPKAFWASGTSAAFTTWLSPDYAPDTNPHRWPQEVWHLSTSKPPNDHPTLLFYIYGDCARYIVEHVHGATEEQRHSFLDRFFRPYYSRLPGYDAHDESCRPQAFLPTEWLKDELSGFASYCNFQVGAEEADEDVLALRHGCPERCLWFCGEHAAPFEHCGTVTGAYLSGQDVGGRIAEVYQAGRD